MRRLTVPEAAEALGITTDAVRMRLSRATLDSERVDGRVYVLLEDEVSADRSGEYNALISEMRARIESLERQLELERDANRENRRLLAAALERIPPQLEAPEEPPEGPETAESPGPRESPFTDEERAQEAAQPRPWWRRMFGG
jgi:hypothetical protein